MHRDPQTGQFVEGHSDEPVDLNYSDHEFVNFRIETDFQQAGDENRGVEYQVESDILDLENDELGMLTWMNASLAIYSEGFMEDAGSTTRGGAVVNAEIGANLAGSEYPAQTNASEGIQQVDNEANVNTLRTSANDEPGLWAHLNASVQGGFKDTDADGTFSGNGTADNDRIRRVYVEETGEGPYIDSTDDINVGVFMEKQDFRVSCRTVVYGQMAFLIHEYENRRQEFAPYDPA